MAATIASATRPTSSTGPTSLGPRRSDIARLVIRTDVDLDLARDDLNDIATKADTQGVGTLSGAGVVLPTMGRAYEAVARELSKAQWQGSVPAAVLVGADRSLYVNDQDGPSIDRHAGHLSDPEVVLP